MGLPDRGRGRASREGRACPSLASPAAHGLTCPPSFCAAVTVIGMFEELAPPAGSYVISTAAGSALGKMWIRYCAVKGVKSINLVRRTEQIPELKVVARGMGAPPSLSFLARTLRRRPIAA